MTTFTWLKLYVEMLDDPKVGMMADWTFRRFIQFLLVARERNQNGLLGPVSELAWRLRSSEDDMLNALRTMSETGIVAETPDGWKVVNFEKRQMALSPTERSREFQKRKRNDCKTERFTNENEDKTLESDDSLSSSSSESVSDSERGGVGEKTKEVPALHLFTDILGKFHGKGELERWLVIVDAVGMKQAGELVAWADKKEIHLINRPGLLDSLETAAKHWHEKQQSKQTKTFAEQLAEA
jgi:hypothetical protein